MAKGSDHQHSETAQSAKQGGRFKERLCANTNGSPGCLLKLYISAAAQGVLSVSSLLCVPVESEWLSSGLLLF